MNAVLIIVAHMDDETLGCGGAIAQHVASGDKVYAVSMTDGVGSRGIDNKGDTVQARQQAGKTAAKILGFQWIEHDKFFPDNALDTVPLLDITKVIEKIKGQIKPKIIYTHHKHDLNIDHQLVFKATLTAFRPQPHESWEELRTFEVASATDYGHFDAASSFNPNLIINILDVWEAKLKALHAYDLEMRDSPHARSYKGLELLARYRGVQYGLEMAECFEIIRKIQR